MTMRMLKSTLQVAGPRLATIPISRNPQAEQRQRGRKWMAIRERWFKAHPLCAACERAGRIEQATQLDHIVPLIDGGQDAAPNYQGLCERCHSIKTASEAKARARHG